VEWGGEEGNWRLACPMASHAAFPAMLRLGWFEGQDLLMTAAGRLTSVNRSLGSCTREGARRDGGAATVQSKNTRKSLRCKQQQCTADCERAFEFRRTGEPGILRTNKENGSQDKFLLGALSLSRMGKLRQCVTGKARARACEQQDSAPMPMSISGGQLSRRAYGGG